MRSISDRLTAAGNVISIMRQKLIEVLWDVDPLDWKTDNSSVIAKRVMDKVQENDIILLHDASDSSVNAAFLIIDELQGEGYSFVTVEELILE